jgi:hypothetical protein
MSKLFTGDVTFHDCSDVATGRRRRLRPRRICSAHGDLARLREVDAMFEQRFPDLRRPELLGYLVGVHDDEDGAFILTAYFSSEEAARAGGREEPPTEAAELLREEMELMQDVVDLDLRDPWLHSPPS